MLLHGFDSLLTGRPPSSFHLFKAVHLLLLERSSSSNHPQELRVESPFQGLSLLQPNKEPHFLPLDPHILITQSLPSPLHTFARTIPPSWGAFLLLWSLPSPFQTPGSVTSVTLFQASQSGSYLFSSWPSCILHSPSRVAPVTLLCNCWYICPSSNRLRVCMVGACAHTPHTLETDSFLICSAQPGAR